MINEHKNLNDFLPNKNATYFNKFHKIKNEQHLITKDEVIKCIKTVIDPEIPVNLYDLGLIYEINISNNAFTKVRSQIYNNIDDYFICDVPQHLKPIQCY